MTADPTGAAGRTDLSAKVWVTVGLVVSTAGAWYHNAEDFPGMSLWAPEMLMVFVPPVVLGIWFWMRPGRAALLAIAVWVLLSLVVGAFLTVLPLPVLPFEPAQTVTHYQAHLLYAASQIPLLVILVALAPRFSPSSGNSDQ